MKKYFLIILILFVTTTTVKSTISTYKIDSNEIFIEYAKVAAYMAKRYMTPNTNTLAVIEFCSIFCNGNYNYQNEILNDILNNLNDQIAIQLFLGNYDERLWDYNIFIVDSYKSFQ